MTTIFTRAVAIGTAEELKREKPGKGKPIRFLASSAGVKRDGLSLDPENWFFENFERNPVFLRFHNYWSTPIGRVETFVTDRGLEVDVYFDSADQEAVEFERKYRDGFMHAISVGWDFVKRMRDENGELTEDESEARETQEGYDLLDVSAVAVPGDPDALIERSKRAMHALFGEGDEATGLTREDVQALMRETVQEAVSEIENTVKTTVNEALEESGGRGEGDGEGDDLDLVYAVDPNYFAAEIAWALEQIRMGKFANDPDGERAGAVLNKQNLMDLKEALAKIEAVIARGEKQAEDEDDGDGNGDGNGNGDGDGDERSLSWLKEIADILPDEL